MFREKEICDAIRTAYTGPKHFAGAGRHSGSVGFDDGNIAAFPPQQKGEQYEKEKSQKRSRQASRLTKGESSCENQTIKVKSAFFFVRFFVSSACLDAQRSCSRWQTVRMLC